MDEIIGLGHFEGSEIKKGFDEQETEKYDQKVFDDYINDWKKGKVVDKNGEKVSQIEAIKMAFDKAKIK
jgi:hypothetical protein